MGKKIKSRRVHKKRREQPLVSVLMSTFNRRQFLPRAIQSIVNQTHTNWELVLVNDGGQSVSDIVERIDDKRICLIEYKENRGKSHAINRAFLESQGSFIAYLDDDDIWYPNHLSLNLAPMVRENAIEMTYSNAYDVILKDDGNGGYVEASRALRYNKNVSIKELIEFNHIQGMSVVHQRDLFPYVGGMDEKLGVLIDWDMWRRLAAVTAPHHVNVVTADHFLRESLTGKGQITSTAAKDPVRYLATRLYIVRKDLPVDDDLQKILNEAKLQATCSFLEAKGKLFELQNRLNRAHISFAHSIRIYPKRSEAKRLLGLMLLKNRTPQEAIPLLLQCVDSEDSQVEDILFAALAYLSMGKGQKTLDLLSRLKNQVTDYKIKGIICDYEEKAGLLIRKSSQY